MKEKSRIRFNPVTKEVEIEGSEEFVKTYFNKVRAWISESANELPENSKASKPSPAQKVQVSAGKKPEGKKVTNIKAIVTIIQESKEGVSTALLKEKTGLSESQIWSIVARATKERKIKKGKRGLYVKID